MCWGSMVVGSSNGKCWKQRNASRKEQADEIGEAYGAVGKSFARAWIQDRMVGVLCVVVLMGSQK